MNFADVFESLLDKLESWVREFILLLPNLVAALLVLLVAWFVAKVVRRLLWRGMERVSTYTAINRLISTLGYAMVLAIGAFIALGIVGLDKAVTTLLAGAGIIGLALGFAFQDMAANFMAGIMISIRRPFREGYIIESGDYMGTVQEINLRSTVIRTFQGQLVIIPNKDVFQNPLVNYSQTGQRRIDLGVGVAYGDDLEKAKRLAVEAVESIDYRDQSREIELFYEEFGDSSINFQIRFWVDFAKQTDFLRARSDAIMRIKRAFDENDITIPFPIRTLDFGVGGGEKLSAHDGSTKRTRHRTGMPRPGPDLLSVQKERRRFSPAS